MFGDESDDAASEHGAIGTTNAQLARLQKKLSTSPPAKSSPLPNQTMGFFGPEPLFPSKWLQLVSHPWIQNNIKLWKSQEGKPECTETKAFWSSSPKFETPEAEDVEAFDAFRSLVEELRKSPEEGVFARYAGLDLASLAIEWVQPTGEAFRKYPLRTSAVAVINLGQLDDIRRGLVNDKPGYPFGGYNKSSHTLTWQKQKAKTTLHSVIPSATVHSMESSAHSEWLFSSACSPKFSGCSGDITVELGFGTGEIIKISTREHEEQWYQNY